MESAIAVSLLVAAVLVISAVVGWRRNLGSTPAAWVMLAIAALILVLWGAFLVALGIGGV
jgi:hypothetical protein